MARKLFPRELVLAAGIPAAGLTLTLWSDIKSGTQYTDVTNEDGVSAVSLVTNGAGLTPFFRGPDGVDVLYVDAGAGRFRLVGVESLADLFPRLTAAEVSISTNTTGLASAVGRISTLETSGGGGGGGGLPAGTTLEQIPNGSTRLAMTANERTKLAGVAAGATALVVGTTAGTAKSGDYAPTASDVGAPRNVSGFGRVWGRTAAQGFPSSAEGAVDGDWLFMDGS
jgi:hypothetical protein